MPLYLLTIAMQIAFAVHVHRTGRNVYWIYLILMVPVIGCAIYFIAEVLPELNRGPAGHKARKKLKAVMDPEKEFRDAKYAFDTAPTVENRIHLAQLLIARKNLDGAIALLEPALTNHFADDVLLLEGLAYAYYDKQDFRKALFYIGKIFARQDAEPQNYIRLLSARSHIALNEFPAAEEELRALVPHFSGEEARITLAQLLMRLGKEGEARDIYQDIVTRASHAPKYYQKQERQWIDMAKQALR